MYAVVCTNGKDTVACQKFKYNFTHFKDCHVVSSICYTVYSKDSLFNSLKIAVIKHRVVLKDNYMRLKLSIETLKLSIEQQTTDGMVFK